MSGPEFFQTGMGRKYYETTLPALVKSINTLAEAVTDSKPSVLDEFTKGEMDYIVSAVQSYTISDEDPKFGNSILERLGKIKEKKVPAP